MQCQYKDCVNTVMLQILLATSDLHLEMQIKLYHRNYKPYSIFIVGCSREL